MFEFLFKYPATAFAKGSFLLLAPWPVWTLLLLVAACGLFLGWCYWRHRSQAPPSISGWRGITIWALQTALAGLLLLMLWQPALSVASLKPRQNVVAVLIDDSRSMGIVEDGSSRTEKAIQTLKGGVLEQLQQKFQVRTYRLGEALQRVDKLDAFNSSATATRIADSLKMAMAEASSLPIGAVLLLSDGAENAGGIDLETISEIRQRRIPVHTIGFGRESFARDLEIADVKLPVRVLADSRVSAEVSIRHSGLDKSKVKLSVKDGNNTLATRTIELKGDGVQQTETVLFDAGIAGAKALSISVEPVNGEQNVNNNHVTRLVNVDARKPRILYLEGEPRWEFKFIRRAIEEDRSLELVTMLRTTQNKVYRQGIADPKELEQGFPASAEELFQYDGIIIGTVEVGYLTAAQQDLIKAFADRRGGGVLFLGGRAALADGGYANSTLAEILPVTLPKSRNTFRRDRASVELTTPGRDSLICRLVEDPVANVERWKKLPQLADFQDPGAAKPGALVLAESVVDGRRYPLLVTQNYGRGRVAVFASGGSWRWQMQQELEDKSHEMFWQQLLRWLVDGSRGQVLASTPKQLLADESKVVLRAEIRDKTHQPVSDATVEARLSGPDGSAEVVELTPDPLAQGVYQVDWTAVKPGSYLAEVVARRGQEELGHDVLTFRREDGVAENFRAEQNRELLEKLSAATGGRYWKPSDLKDLSEEISYSEAGITVRETKDLWDMPILFLIALGLRSAEWLLRRKWGVV